MSWGKEAWPNGDSFGVWNERSASGILEGISEDTTLTVRV